MQQDKMLKLIRNGDMPEPAVSCPETVEVSAEDSPYAVYYERKRARLGHKLATMLPEHFHIEPTTPPVVPQENVYDINR